MKLGPPSKYSAHNKGGTITPPIPAKPVTPPPADDPELFETGDSLEGIGDAPVVTAEIVTFAASDSPTPGEMLSMKSAQSPEMKFAEFLARPRNFAEQSSALKISRTDTPQEQRDKITLAEQLKEVFRNARLEAERFHKAETSAMTHWKQNMDRGRASVVKFCEEHEAHLKEILAFPEREALRIEDENRTYRAKTITPYLVGALTVDLGKISEVEFMDMLQQAREMHEFREAKRLAAEAEAKRLADEAEARRVKEEEAKAAAAAEAAAQAKAEAEARKAEIERLKAEAAEKEAARKAELEKLRKEQEARDKEAAEERRAAEERSKAQLAELAERNRLEKEARDREAAAAAKAAAEEARKAREEAALAREREAAAAAEAKRLRDIEDAKVKAEAEARRKAEAAPDVDKIRSYAKAIRESLTPPRLSQFPDFEKELRDKTAAFARWVDSMAAQAEGGAGK